jgi:hypothetical protein
MQGSRTLVVVSVACISASCCRKLHNLKQLPAARQHWFVEYFRVYACYCFADLVCCCVIFVCGVSLDSLHEPACCMFVFVC